jgi:hypothetical protein
MPEERTAKHFKSRRLGKHQPQEDFRSIFLESNDWPMPHALAISSCYFGWWWMPFRNDLKRYRRDGCVAALACRICRSVSFAASACHNILRFR